MAVFAFAIMLLILVIALFADIEKAFFAVKELIKIICAKMTLSLVLKFG